MRFLSRLKQLRQFNPENTENQADDCVKHQQNGAGNADHHNDTGDQKNRNTNDREGIFVGHSLLCRALTEGASAKWAFLVMAGT